jgi:hypothetical protein
MATPIPTLNKFAAAISRLVSAEQAKPSDPLYDED